MIKRTIALLAIIALGAGCSGKKPESPEEYYEIASEHLRDGAYPLAIENYQELLDQHPFSPLAEDAEFKIAQAHFQNRSCPEAIAGFSDFQRRHPTSPYLPLVGYLIGVCHENQMQKPDRDQSASQSAHAYFQAVINQYPESPFSDLAAERLHHCRESLAQHEYNVAAYYRKMGNRKAAEVRLIDLVKRYNDTDQAADALYDLAAIYLDREEPDKAALAYSALLFHHPDHNLANDAEKKLSKISTLDDRPLGDPVAALMARSGRFRDFQTVDAAEVETVLAPEPGLAPAPKAPPNRPPAYDPLDSGRPNRRYD